jgi:hypothetical protein
MPCLRPEFELQVPLPLQSIQPIFDSYVLVFGPDLSSGIGPVTAGMRRNL